MGTAPAIHPTQRPRGTAPLTPRSGAVRAAERLVPADLPTLSLLDLPHEAALLTRIDRKYVLTRNEVPPLMSGLDPTTRVLVVAGARAQSYGTTYFDTPDLRCFRDCAHPRRRRFKVRTRTYVDAGLSFLEVKTRGPRGRTVKERVPLSPGAPTDMIDEGGRAWVDGVLRGIGLPPGVAATLGPSLHGVYVRTTLLLPGGQGRATIDTSLAWALPDGRSLGRPDLVVIETKSASTPSSLDRLLWSAGHRPQRISKYATALAALEADLPDNRWARTLAAHFHPSPLA